MTSIRSLFAVFPRLVVVACSWSCQLGLWLKFDTRGWVKQTVTGCTSNWQGRPRRHDDEDFQHEPWNDKAISSCSTQLVHQDSVTWLRGQGEIPLGNECLLRLLSFAVSVPEQIILIIKFITHSLCREFRSFRSSAEEQITRTTTTTAFRHN